MIVSRYQAPLVIVPTLQLSFPRSSYRSHAPAWECSPGCSSVQSQIKQQVGCVALFNATFAADIGNVAFHDEPVQRNLHSV